MIRWSIILFRILVSVGSLTIAAELFGPLDYALKYYHFKTLTKERLVHEAQAYIDERAGGGQMACVYFVSCDGERARLEMVEDADLWDFLDAKGEIWRRRFNDYCPGRTTNIALHLIPLEGQETRIDAVSHARWSFVNDRFIPRHGRFQNGSFTDQPWERCTPEKALVR